jgi:CheY-like chemotaxis protein
MGQQKGKPRILIVDNDAEYRSTVKEALEEVGYEVVGASCALDAIEQANERRHGFNLALIDVRLNDDDDSHDHSGLKLLHDLPANLPVVILTAHEDARVVRAAYQSASGQPDPKDYLFKGDGLEAIIRCVGKVSSEVSPEARPWYKEPTFFYLAVFTVLLIVGGGFYIEFVSEGNQLLGVIVVGVVIEIFAGVLLHFLKIGH